MPFTAAEIGNIANATLDYYMRGPADPQSLQDKPLMASMEAKEKTFPGGKEDIRGNVKGDYTTAFMGYSHDDTVTYANPANIKQWNYGWKELHAGISLTLTELKKAGISVVDSLNSEKTTDHSDREVVMITDLLKEKYDDMQEGADRSFNSMLWLDGSQSAKVFAGVQSFVTLNPAVGLTGGIDRASNRWWRNRARVGSLSAETGRSTVESITGSKITASASSQTLTKTLRQEVRQLRRFGGKPSLILCGSSFLDSLETEVHEKGTYTQQGFVNNGKNDIGMSMLSMRGVGDFQYDPTLDDLGYSKFCYILDPATIYPMVMDGEDMKTHAPARPPEKYVLYRAITWTGGLICRKLNANGVYEVA